jgi:hypothetical protein
MGTAVTIEPYPGLHPGTGTNDHLHMGDWYRLDIGGTVYACQICGSPLEPPAEVDEVALD